MIRQVTTAVEKWAWFLPIGRNCSADQFTARMIDKYGQAFYDAWTPREQDRYATLRLREEEGIQYPGRPLAPRTAFLASLVALVFAAIAVSLLGPWKPLKGLENNLVATSKDRTTPRKKTELPRGKKSPQPKQKEGTKLKVLPLEPTPKSHVYFPSKRSTVLILDVKKTAGLLASHANQLYDEGDYALAAHGYEEIIQLGVSTAATHNNLACCLYQVSSGDQSRVIEHFSFAIDYDPTNPSLYQNRGKVLSQQSNLEDQKAGIKDLFEAKGRKGPGKQYQRRQDEPIDVVLPLHRYGRTPEPEPLRKKTRQPIQ